MLNNTHGIIRVLILSQEKLEGFSLRNLLTQCWEELKRHTDLWSVPQMGKSKNCLLHHQMVFPEPQAFRRESRTLLRLSFGSQNHGGKSFPMVSEPRWRYSPQKRHHWKWNKNILDSSLFVPYSFWQFLPLARKPCKCSSQQCSECCWGPTDKQII